MNDTLLEKKKKVITEETIEENSGMVSFPTVKQK